MSITPPYTTKISCAPSTPTSSTTTPKESINNNNTIFNNYIKESSIFITSLWLNPTKSTSLFQPISILKSTDFEKYLKEVLKRSRCSLHVFQLSIYYLFKLQKAIKNRFVDGNSNSKSLNCPKRVFLMCLILGFKFSHDQSYRFRTWSKISGLNIKELQTLEMFILNSLNYELNISKEDYSIWIEFLETSLKRIETSYIQVKSSKRSFEDAELTSNKRLKACA